MYVDVKNENYGYRVSTYGDYVVVANPPLLRWDSATASLHYTGTVDYFRYNKNTDEHDYIGTLYKNEDYINADLITENANTGSTGPNYLITAESSSVPYSGYDIAIDRDLYTSSFENGFGLSLDMYGKLLIVGSPYSTQIIATSASLITASGATVEIHDLSKTELNPPESTFITTVFNPDQTITESFGKAVSMNSAWIAIGSPYASSSRGVVYLYRNTSTGSNYAWTYFQMIEPSSSLATAMFGSDLKLNKTTSSLSQSLVVGCENTANNAAYYFELISGSWTETFQFAPTAETASLTIGNYPPYDPQLNAPDGTTAFGYAVSTFEDAVVVGSWSDRSVYEFSGSALYQQGSAYIFQKCPNLNYTKFELVFKTYGTPETLKDNRLGYSVDIYGNNAVVGIPKTDNLGIISCYVQGTLDQLHQCTTDLTKTLLGQAMLVQKNTSSGDWEITNVYQRKKKYLSPYRSFGNDVAIDGRSMVVGAPMLFTDSNRIVNLNVTSSSGVVLDDVTGKAYIYNLNNLRDQFHVGNVFYRNGKIVIMTSGSVFDGLFFNPINSSTYEYDLKFQGQHTIFEKQVICTVNPGEFNVSTNPTAVTKMTSSLNVNDNQYFDFQDLDVILRYMQYKNTSLTGISGSTEWSSSIITTDDERSLYKFYVSQSGYDAEETSLLTSESIIRWESTETWIQDVLDLNQDNKIDIRDMNILWKFFTNRLTQENYATYITPACNRKLFSDIIDYLNFLIQRKATPYINTQFLDYESHTATDKTGSYLAPMATTIGLYNGLDLVAVAKLGSPIKISPELPINFVVKLDY